MAFDNVGEFPIQTNANNRAAVQIAGATSSNILAVASDGSVTARLAAGTDGTAFGHVSDALKVDLSSQGVTAMKISATAAANTLANPLFVQRSDGAATMGSLGNPDNSAIVVGGAVKGATGSPFFVELNQGAAALSVTNGLFVNPLQGNAVLSATNGGFQNILQGNAVLSATNGLFANQLQGNAVLSATNPSFTSVVVAGAVVSSVNPLPVSTAAAATVGTILRGSVDTAYQKDAAVASQTSVNHDFTVPVNKTLTIFRVRVSASGAARFDVILDATGGTPVTIDTIHIGPGGGSDEINYSAISGIDKPTVAATKIFRIVKTNNERSQTQDLYTSWIATKTP